jgi:hypothetical protein
LLELVPKPQFTVVVPPRLIQEGYLVHFTDAWPSTLQHVRGRTFRADVVNQVPYSTRYIIPTSDYRDVDLSNGNGTFQESLMPTRNNSLFEVSLGLSPGAYVVHFFIPATRHVHALEFAGMTPDVNSPTLVYLGARRPDDSPSEDPRIKFYLVRDLAPLILRLFVLPGVSFEKIILDWTINRINMTEIDQPSQEQLTRSKVIRYFEEYRTF